MRLTILLAIALGGAAGAVCRYLLSAFISGRFAYAFPWGTWTINIIGCLFLGFLLKSGASSPYPVWRISLTIGFIGSFTTFAGFEGEVYDLLRAGKVSLGMLYFLSSNLVGAAMIYLGNVLFGQIFHGK